MAGSSNPSALDELLDGPALKPPPGVIPELDNPPSFSTVATAVPTVIIILSTLAIAMRAYTQISIIRKVTLADYSIFVAWCLFTAYISFCYLSGLYAPGIHQWNLRLRNLGPFLYYVHVGSIVYGICTFFIKLSILTQYIQIFMPGREPKALYLITVLLIIINFIFYFISTFLEIFACRPINKVWDPLITEGWCIDVLALNWIASSINSVSDISILALPQFIIWRLNMSVRHKAAISFIFFIAIIACISAVVRLVYAVLLYHNQEDLAYYTWFAGLWTLPELGGGIIVACLPVTRVFYSNMVQSKAFLTITSALSKLGPGSTFESQRDNAGSKAKSNDPSGHDLQGDDRDNHNRSHLWARAYGVVTTLFSQTDSDSIAALRTSEGHSAYCEDGISRTAATDIHSGSKPSFGPNENWHFNQSIEMRPVTPIP